MINDQRVFFSYSRIDGEKFALQLATDLRKAGCNIWIDQLDIRPGKPWDLEIEKALESAASILFIVTEKSVASKNTLDEVYYAIDNNKEVIPAIFASCPMPFRLKRLQHIDFTKDYNNALIRLVDSLKANGQVISIEQQNNKPADVPIKNVSHEAQEKFITQPAQQEKPNNRKLFFAGGLILLFIILFASYFFMHQNNTGNNVISNSKSLDSQIKKNDTSTLLNKTTGQTNVSGQNVNKELSDMQKIDKTKQIQNSVFDTPTSKKSNITPALPKPRLNSDTNYYRLQIKSNGAFVDAAYCGNKVALSGSSDFDGGACQLWRLVPVKDGWYGLQLKNGEKYLMAENCSSSLVLVPASEFDPNDGCQLWKLVSNGDGWSRLQLRNNKQYLDADHCSTTLGLNTGSDFDGGACQLWRFLH